MTSVNGAVISTAQSKFGGASGLFQSNARIGTGDSSDWIKGTGSWTLRKFIRFIAIPSVEASAANLYCQRNDDNNIVAFNINTANKFRFIAYSGGTELANYTYDWTPSIDTWYHIELVRNGSTSLLLFIDGDLKTWTNITTALGSTSLPDLTGDLEIGGRSDTAIQYLNGYLDQYSLHDYALHTANFTPPTSEY